MKFDYDTTRRMEDLHERATYILHRIRRRGDMITDLRDDLRRTGGHLNKELIRARLAMAKRMNDHLMSAYSEVFEKLTA